MKSPAVRSMARRWHRSIVPGGAIVLSLMLAHCGSGGGGGGGSDGDCDAGSSESQCDAPLDSCPSTAGFARVCELDDDGSCSLLCVNVCDRPGDLRDDSVPFGGQCEFDADCEGVATCDNDTGRGDSSCTCVTRSTCDSSLDVAYSNRNLPTACTAARHVKEIGGTPGRWQLKRTCRRVDGTCYEDSDDIGIGRDFTDTTDLCWVDDNYRKASGSMCGKDFSFVEIQASGEYQTGVFQFSSSVDLDAHWIIYSQLGGSMVARCTGNGRADSAGSPDSTPDCDEYHPFGD